MRTDNGMIYGFDWAKDAGFTAFATFGNWSANSGFQIPSGQPINTDVFEEAEVIEYLPPKLIL